MNTHTQSDPPINQLSEAARETARRAAGAVRETAERAAAAGRDVTKVVEDVTDASKDAVNRATDTAKEMYHSVAQKAGETLTTSKEYVLRNPVPVILGAVAFGAAIGYMLLMARRKPTFGQRYAAEPLGAVREAILGALAPVSQRVHEGYDSARNGAGKVINRVHNFNPGRANDSLADQIGRISNNLKFW